jgi:mono/diheme cytochrome c family protein
MIRALAGALVLITLYGGLERLTYAAQAPTLTLASASYSQGASSKPILEGVFTAEQAERGKQLYPSRCAQCHGDELVSDSDAPSLTAQAFRYSWHQKTIAERFERIRTTMPPGGAGSLSDQEYLDVVAYILQFNKYPAGAQELAPEKSLLEKIVIEPVS